MEVKTLRNTLAKGEVEALVNTLGLRVTTMKVNTLADTLFKVEAEAVVYLLTNRVAKV